MSKKKSLGSSPIEYKAQRSSMDFIPDLGVSASSKQQKNASRSVDVKQNGNKQDQHQKTKKVVSYSLDTELINKVKAIANKKDIYYSSLVSQALKSWIGRHS